MHCAGVKKRLAMNEPTIMAGGFLYEEGEGLEDDEASANAALLPRPLAGLPGGGLGHGALAIVRDQSQDVSLQLVIEHQARPCGVRVFLLTWGTARSRSCATRARTSACSWSSSIRRAHAEQGFSL